MPKYNNLTNLKNDLGEKMMSAEFSAKVHIILLIMALSHEVLQRSERTYVIDRGYFGFCQHQNPK